MGKRLINVDEVEEIVPVLVGKLLENNLITEEQADQIICAIFNDNDRLNEIRELNPDYDISMHKLNVCVGDSQYRLVYCIYVEHKESGISVYRDKDFDVQEVINRLPSKFTIEKEQELLPKGVNIKIHKYSINCAVSLFSNAAATTRPQLTALTKGLYANAEFMLIGGNMKSVSTDGGQNWTTSTLGAYTLTDLIYVDSNWYAIGSNGTKRLLLQNTASTFDQSNKILDLPDYSRQVIKINV